MAWFRISFAEKAFLRILSSRGLSLDTLQVEDGVDAMLEFYRDHRAQHTRLDENGDVLVLQWSDARLAITRQLVRSGTDGPVMQLCLAFGVDRGLPAAGQVVHSDPTASPAVPGFFSGPATSTSLTYEAC